VPGVDGFGAVGFIGKSDWADCCLTNPLESGLVDSAVSVNLTLSLSLFVLLMLRPLLDGLFPGGDADNGLPPSAPLPTLPLIGFKIGGMAIGAMLAIAGTDCLGLDEEELGRSVAEPPVPSEGGVGETICGMLGVAVA
jgi:hypothetical protein